MHNEHGKFTESESGKIESLASLFQDKVSIYDVSPENKSAASFITIPYSDVEVEGYRTCVRSFRVFREISRNPRNRFFERRTLVKLFA